MRGRKLVRTVYSVVEKHKIKHCWLFKKTRLPFLVTLHHFDMAGLGNFDLLRAQRSEIILGLKLKKKKNCVRATLFWMNKDTLYKMFYVNFFFFLMKSKDGNFELARNVKFQWGFETEGPNHTPNMRRNSSSLSSTYPESPSSPSGRLSHKTNSRQQALASLQSLCSRAVMESNSKFTANSFCQLFSKNVSTKAIKQSII